MLLADGLIGHSKQTETLLTDYTTGNLAHAYLFYGPAQIGKFTLANYFGNLLQCENELCGVCPACKQFQSRQHLDTIFLDDTDGESIKIEEIRSLVAKMSNTSQSPYKICLIERIERMTREASNAFLKILEEPSSDTIFLLTTSSLSLLLPTITSRCRLLRFSLVSDEEIKKDLSKLKLELRNDNKEVLKFAAGRPGKVISLLRDPELFEQEKQLYLDLKDLFSKQDLIQRFQYVSELSKDPQKIKVFLNQLTFFLREKMRELDPDQEKEQVAKIMRKLEEVSELRECLARSVNAKLALENLLLDT